MSAETLGLSRAGGRQQVAAALAAAAEAGVVYLPLSLAISNVSTVPGYLLFTALYCASVAATARFRDVRGVGGAVAVMVLLIGLALARVASGAGAPGPVIVLAFLVLGLRVVVLGYRDWHEPLDVSSLVAGVALLGEASFAGGTTGWNALLWVIVPVFFLGTLASRAASMWLVGSPLGVSESDRWMRRAARVATVGLVVGAAVAVGFGGRGGLAARAGVAFTWVVAVVASVLVLVMSQIARFVFFLLRNVHVDARAFERTIQRLRANVRSVRTRSGPVVSGPHRLFGLLVFGALAYVVYRAIRRRRPEILAHAEAAPSVRASEGLREKLPVVQFRLAHRREMPADRVRRWYAEILLALERRKLVRGQSQTPGEFLGQVGEAYPACAGSLESITRAYEDVRYGRLKVDRAGLKKLARDHEHVLKTIRSG